MWRKACGPWTSPRRADGMGRDRTKDRERVKDKKKSGPAPAPSPCPIELVTAGHAGEALVTVASKLGGANILTSEGARILDQEGRRIAKGRDDHGWRLVISPEMPLTFERTRDKRGDEIVPWLCASMSVNPIHAELPPFEALDVAIQFDKGRLGGEPVARWHVDFANKQGDGFQPGPLTHLQYGGHQRDHRDLDHPLKAPRWCHPPMEAALVCEVIAANFFEAQWMELRDDPSWCRAISLFQRLCYSAYFNKMVQSVTQPGTTALNQAWARDWDKSARHASDQASAARAS